VRIAIVGTGHIGSSLARGFVAAGHEVIVSNSRAPETLADLVDELGPNASAATPGDAMRAAEIVVVSVPLKNYRDVPKDGVADKVVIDTMNYFPERDGRFAEIDSGQTGSSELLAAHLRGARIVKVFNTVNWERLRDGGRPKGDPGRIALALSGDDADAKAEVSRLVDELGFDAVDVGSLAKGGRKQQPGGPLFTSDLPADELRAAASA
jgi:8-hydroxy-5-deazaflavin:NADPH oxidoreductase